MLHLLTRFFRDEWGATAIEIGLIAAGISIAIISAVQPSPHGGILGGGWPR